MVGSVAVWRLTAELASRLPLGVSRMADRAAEKYAEAVGTDALERQRAQRGERHPCCGELIAAGHHMMCSKRPDDQEPAHIDGQASLL